MVGRKKKPRPSTKKAAKAKKAPLVAGPRTIQQIAEAAKTNPGSLTPGEVRFLTREIAKRKSPEQKYEEHRDTMARKKRAQSGAGRDIGPIPNIRDTARRLALRDDPEQFCLTYNPEAFSLPFCQDHRDAIARIREAATLGALYAFAMPRGSGKTTLCRMLALWALSYRFCRYILVVGANEEKALDNLDAVATFMRFLPLYAQDFPEIAYPAKKLGGIAQGAHGQLCQGEPTLISWGKRQLVLPTVAPPKNWPDDWPTALVPTQQGDAMRRVVPTSGSVVGSSGLTGDGIRGSVLALASGEQLRPDLVLLDDPQTHESAHSPTQNATRYKLVSADILGLAGPGKSLSAVMPCTVIAPDDMADRVLDNAKNPLWRGERRRMLVSMPKNLDAWDRHLEVYRQCALTKPPDFEPANRDYAANRAILDEGAVASWEARKLPDEISAIQHAMYLYCRDPVAFASEYQNQPLAVFDPDNELPKLTADEVMVRCNQHDRGLVPAWATTLTAGIDVGQNLLHYVVCAWGNGYQGSVVDYGTWPRQARLYFASNQAKPTIQQATGAGTVDASIRRALDSLADQLCREWKQENGSPLRLSRCLVDSGWKKEVVHRFCRESKYGGVLTPSRGLPLRAAQSPIGEWPKREGERREPGPDPRWLIRAGAFRTCMIDTNLFKAFVHDRILAPPGEKSALMLFGKTPSEHRLFADHVCAEFRVRTTARGRTVDMWELKPNAENHFWDALILSAVAASMQGVTLAETAPPRPKLSNKEKQRIQLEKLRDRQRTAAR